MTPAGKYVFEPAVINAKPGEALLVRLKSTGNPMPKMAMSHNFVLVKPKTNLTTFATDAIAAGFPANFIPAGRKLIWRRAILPASGRPPKWRSRRRWQAPIRSCARSQATSPAACRDR